MFETGTVYPCECRICSGLLYTIHWRGEGSRMILLSFLTPSCVEIGMMVPMAPGMGRLSDSDLGVFNWRVNVSYGCSVPRKFAWYRPNVGGWRIHNGYSVSFEGCNICSESPCTCNGLPYTIILCFEWPSLLTLWRGRLNRHSWCRHQSVCETFVWQWAF